MKARRRLHFAWLPVFLSEVRDGFWVPTRRLAWLKWVCRIDTVWGEHYFIAADEPDDSERLDEQGCRLRARVSAFVNGSADPLLVEDLHNWLSKPGPGVTCHACGAQWPDPWDRCPQCLEPCQMIIRCTSK